MKSPLSIAITDRFFEAYDVLCTRGDTWQEAFCRELQADKRNFVKQQKDHSRSIIQLGWLTHLVTHYHVSAEWLLTGKGGMFKEMER